MMMQVVLGELYRDDLYVEQGDVVYLALEGGRGFRRRKEAWARHHADKLKGREAPLFFLIDAPVAIVHDHVDVIASIEAQAVKPSVVVIDTLNRTLGGGSESDDRDMGALIKAVDAIRARFGCTVILVHHCGHDGSRPRGHSALLGAYDVLIHVTKSEAGLINVEVQETRDDEPPPPFSARLEPVELGVNQRGARLQSRVVVYDETPCAARSPTDSKVKTSDKQMV